MRSFGASRCEVAIDVGPKEVQRSVRAGGIDVEVLEVIAHDEGNLGERICESLGHLSVFNLEPSRRKQVEHTVAEQSVVIGIEDGIVALGTDVVDGGHLAMGRSFLYVRYSQPGCSVAA